MKRTLIVVEVCLVLGTLMISCAPTTAVPTTATPIPPTPTATPPPTSTYTPGPTPTPTKTPMLTDTPTPTTTPTPTPTPTPLPLTPTAMPAPAFKEPVHEELAGLEINEPTIWENKTIRLKGILIINSILNLNNVTLTVESPSDGNSEIIVNGELNIERSIIRAADPDYGYKFVYRPGSRGRIQDTIIEDVGFYSPAQLNPGLLIESSHVVVEGNSFRHCRGTCIWVSASELRIVNNLFEETRQGGIQIGAPDVHCTNIIVANNTLIKIGKLSHPGPHDICYADSDDGIGIDFQRAEGKVFGNSLSEGRCSAIEIERGSTIDVYDNKISNNLDWAMNIHDQGTVVHLYNNVIENIILRPAIWVYNGAVAKIENNTISGATKQPVRIDP
ncbi:MAG: right-handed parallel beta-helix repeat-containing protein [Anaerolineae bacterium]|nr:right-handed parallel beta-helix repeat-containing protein [Anaerolineae bacterium]